MKQYHALLLALAACKTSNIPDSNPPQIVVGLVEASAPEASVVVVDSGDVQPWAITLSRSVCYGVCPDYTVTVKSDGSIEYDGRRFVSKKGRATDTIPTADAEALLRAFEGASFDRLSVPQDCPKGMATDNPTNVLALKRGGRLHVIDHYLGNMCAPPVLTTLADAVDKTAKTDRWIKCAGGYCSKP